MAKAAREHHYEVKVEWTGNHGTGTTDYRAYGRDHTISAGSKPNIGGSSDPAFRGDNTRWNPEDLLVAALSACHMLWYLHLCSVNGIAVAEYIDNAYGCMVEDPNTGGHFTKVILVPSVTVHAADDVELALRLHRDAHAKCFIANSVNFPVEVRPVINRGGETKA
jgi:organic hydroperoxide reductase OsmC/OhrA